ncbi:MAG: DNA polymerase domain-containing protein [Bacteroidota bacterium]|nr:DNA polymerase domain-containing protein [Bacteroidota bacterium]
MTISGWLFDVYPNTFGMTVWIIDKNGTQHKTSFRFAPCFYLDLSEKESIQLHEILKKVKYEVTVSKVRKTDVYAAKEIDVYAVHVHNPNLYFSAVRELSKYFKFYQFYNADIKLVQMFYYTTGLFPLAEGDFEIENGVLRSWNLRDTINAVKYNIPPLTIMSITPSAKLLAPKYQRYLEIEIEVDGRKSVLQQESPREVIQQINYYLHKYDPDVIMTEYGDGALLPLLQQTAHDLNMPLYLNRDIDVGYFMTKAVTYFSYGQIKHRDGIVALAGRWHLDRENSFIMSEGDMAGLLDLSRMSQIGVQQQARTSIGSALSSMQVSWTYQNNALVPYKRPIKEAFKSLATLLKSDRGGLHFMPTIGYHEQVAELDFASMYPTLMKNHNISPETLDCPCCPDAKNHVPEIHYRLCEKRTGLVPTTLKPILEKRAHYKELKKHAPTPELKQKYDHMQSGLKWILVTCFGYLGFKKSRLGRIEAHEAVNAFARDRLLRAKEIAEENGFHLLHAIVDCMWLKKEGATHEDYERLAVKIEEAVGVKMSLEGIYKWILFPASKMDEEIPTATRYVGVYDTNEFKIRGIEVRRRDTTKYIKRAQEAMLEVLAGANSLVEVGAMVPQVLDVTKKFVDDLKQGNVSPFELVIRRRISKDPYEYANKNVNAIVSQTLVEAGVKLMPGESIQYIITDATGKKDPMKAKPLALYALDDGYDAEKYSDMVLEAAETLLEPLGYNKERLKEELGLVKKKIKKISRRRKSKMLSDQLSFAPRLMNP